VISPKGVKERQKTKSSLTLLYERRGLKTEDWIPALLFYVVKIPWQSGLFAIRQGRPIAY
jgi:hypothetical protein